MSFINIMIIYIYIYPSFTNRSGLSKLGIPPPFQGTKHWAVAPGVSHYWPANVDNICGLIDCCIFLYILIDVDSPGHGSG